MNIASYTRNLAKAFLIMHANALRRVYYKAADEASDALVHANNGKRETDAAAAAVHEMIKDTKARYKDANEAHKRANRIATAVHEEIAALPFINK